MSLIPEFELGFWNAWIITALFFLPILTMFLTRREAVRRMTEGESTWNEMGRSTKIAYPLIFVIILPFTIGYSIFLPLKLGTVWLYSGLSLSVLGTALASAAYFLLSTAPLDAPQTRGVYRYSRNPGYVGQFLMYVGIGLAGASWVFLLCAAAFIASWQVATAEEERRLIEKYGDAYREYMDRTPKWIGLPKRT